jgi:hypothetical protein
VERENAFFKSSPVDEYHLLQENSEKDFFLGAGFTKSHTSQNVNFGFFSNFAKIYFNIWTTTSFFYKTEFNFISKWRLFSKWKLLVSDHGPHNSQKIGFLPGSK